MSVSLSFEESVPPPTPWSAPASGFAERIDEYYQKELLEIVFLPAGKKTFNVGGVASFLI
jgi:hypothetical protein